MTPCDGDLTHACGEGCDPPTPTISARGIREEVAECHAQACRIELALKEIAAQHGFVLQVSYTGKEWRARFDRLTGEGASSRYMNDAIEEAIRQYRQAQRARP